MLLKIDIWYVAQQCLTLHMSIQCIKPESGDAKILLLAMYTHIHMQWQRNRNMIGEAGVRGCEVADYLRWKRPHVKVKNWGG